MDVGVETRIENWLQSAPRAGGTYALLFRLDRDIRIAIGGLGERSLTPGWYVYAGSALGPGGLRGRLGHHLRRPARPHWHLDYLHDWLTPVGVWTQVGPERLECAWAQAVDGEPVEGVGASDCRNGCRAHLLRARRPERLAFAGGEFTCFTADAPFHVRSTLA